MSVGAMKHARLHYTRDGARVRLQCEGLTNHEIREVLIGVWSRLDADDQADHIRELQHYLGDESAFLSPLARAIADGGKESYEP